MLVQILILLLSLVYFAVLPMLFSYRLFWLIFSFFISFLMFHCCITVCFRSMAVWVLTSLLFALFETLPFCNCHYFCFHHFCRLYSFFYCCFVRPLVIYFLLPGIYILLQFPFFSHLILVLPSCFTFYFFYDNHLAFFSGCNCNLCRCWKTSNTAWFFIPSIFYLIQQPHYP